MNKFLTLKEVFELNAVPNNLYLEGNNVLLEKHMTLNEVEKNILQKWKINSLELRSHIETKVEGFNILYNYDKEFFTRLYSLLQREVQEFYENIEKGYKIPFPDFSNILKQLSKMTTVKALSFIFHIHLQSCNSLIKASIRTAVYCYLVGKRLNFSEKSLEIVFYGSIISDIGFLKRSENYLINLLRGKKVKPFDFSYLNQHIAKGMDLYKELLNYPKEYALTLLLHHDYTDGSGINKVSKEKLNLEIQLVTLCQEFTYATSNFLERACPPLNYTNAITYIIKNKHKYNEKIINAFVSLFTFYPPGMLLVLNSGEIAISVASRTQYPNFPTIEKVANAKGNPISNPETIITEKTHTKILAYFNNKNISRKIIKTVYGK